MFQKRHNAEYEQTQKINFFGQTFPRQKLGKDPKNGVHSFGFTEILEKNWKGG